MPAIPGENLLTTLFADVHYYFSDPSTKPQHHRFDRGSYVYVYQNPVQRTAKLEVANHAGTPEQDAFSGYLDIASLKYSHKQPSLFTVTTNGASVQGHSQWHLPSYNEKNEQKYLYRIHSIDIYLWTEKDAVALLGHLKNVLSSDRLDIRDAPKQTDMPAEHRDSMSPVVQQLEQASIGAQYPPRADSTSTAQSFQGPPTPSSTVGSPQPQAPAPMAYNPAAPAAPEPIAYREKTPPPPDDGNGTGLNSAPKTQYASAPSGGFPYSGQVTPQQSYFTGPPSQSNNHVGLGAFAGPPQRTASGGLPPPPPPPAGGPSPPQQSSYRQSTYQPAQQQQPQTQYASYPQSPGFAPSMQSPGIPSGQQQHTPLQSPGLPPPPSNQPPPGGYSTYNYQQQQPPQQTLSGSYTPHGGYVGNTHSQVYRPTETEAQYVGKQADQHRPQVQQQGGQVQSQGQGGKVRLEDRMQGLEKGMGRLFKKLDRAI